jgi:hypothetical protein
MGNLDVGTVLVRIYHRLTDSKEHFYVRLKAIDLKTCTQKLLNYLIVENCKICIINVFATYENFFFRKINSCTT